jgi:hypothetical protein
MCENTCNICVTKYNKKNYKVSCNKCNKDSCNKCIQQYIISSNKEECMYCNKKFDNTFILDNLQTKFINTQYKQFQKNKYFEIEKKNFPDTMVKIDILKKRNYYINLYKDINIKRQQNINNIKKVIYSVDLQVITLILENFEVFTNFNNEEHIEFYNKCNNLKQRYVDIEIMKLETLQQKNKIIKILKDDVILNRKRKRVLYNKLCIKENCNGMISDNNKCGICESLICEKCNIIINTEIHVCKQDDISTHELLKVNTKHCPGCNIPIQKIDGCNQFFCTQCHIKFDWSTLRIIKDNELFHNPHHMDIIENNENLIPTEFNNNINNNIIKLNELYINLNIIINKYRLDNTDNTQISIYYLINKINEEEYKNELYKKYKNINKKQDFYNKVKDVINKIKCIINNFIIEFENLYNNDNNSNNKYINLNYLVDIQINNIIIEFNNEFKILKKRYNCRSYQLNDNILLINI